jgi:hypothetical protein
MIIREFLVDAVYDWRHSFSAKNRASGNMPRGDSDVCSY